MAKISSRSKSKPFLCSTEQKSLEVLSSNVRLLRSLLVDELSSIEHETLVKILERVDLLVEEILMRITHGHFAGFRVKTFWRNKDKND